ncbi:hypothetical protein LR48_Vigan09g011200 [Vigna angularis]|uniref:Uncharacterized protein n=1 Tax=Phaseolus angularis TaxID=3914 RepID=A0A0L9V8Z7_PHAAN|nr:hypothetical protein LR48_Vigan09g011200 [Vigna angularis]
MPQLRGYLRHKSDLVPRLRGVRGIKACTNWEDATKVWRGCDKGTTKERRRHNTVRAVAALPPQGFHLRRLCRNSYSFPQIPPGSKIRVLQMGKGDKHFAFLLLRRYREDGGVAMDGSLRSSRLKLMVMLARKKRTRLR